MMLFLWLAAGAGRVLSASVSERTGRWFVSFTCEAGRSKVEAPAGRPVGVDVGVKCLAVLSTGEQVPNPKHLSRWQRRQARPGPLDGLDGLLAVASLVPDAGQVEIVLAHDALGRLLTKYVRHIGTERFFDLI